MNAFVERIVKLVVTDSSGRWPWVWLGFNEHLTVSASSGNVKFDQSSKSVFFQRPGCARIFSFSDVLVGSLTMLKTSECYYWSLSKENLVSDGLYGGLVHSFVAGGVC